VRPGIPIIVLWLLLGAVFFTLRMGFINLGVSPCSLVVRGADSPTTRRVRTQASRQPVMRSGSASPGSRWP
jgi:hypothetical protein